MNKRPRRIKINSDFTPLSSQITQEQTSTEQDNTPFKPFYMKFIHLKKNLSPYRLPSEEQPSYFQGKSDQLLTKRMLTEVQTNDFYASDFEKESQLLDFRETVREQNQNCRQLSFCDNQQDLQCIFHDESYSTYTMGYLSKKNRQLIDYIQYCRSVLPKFKANILILQKQRIQLQQLHHLQDKVMDYNYQLYIDQAQCRNKTASKVQQQSIKQSSAFFGKQKYRNIKEAWRRANPTLLDMHQGSLPKHRPKRLSIRQEDLLSKKRQYYKYEQKLKLQEQKINEYVRILDAYDSILSKGDVERLQTRKKELSSEIQNKKTSIQIKQIQINLELTNYNNQLASIEARLIEANKKSRLIKEQVLGFRRRNKSDLIKSTHKQYFTKQTKSNRIISLKSNKANFLRESQIGRTKNKNPKAIQSFFQRYKKQSMSLFLEGQDSRS